MKQDATFWDVRLRAALLRRGEMTSAQETAYLQGLPDVADKSISLQWDESANTDLGADEGEHG